jgi:outer membrane lipoprotein-sorting protein
MKALAIVLLTAAWGQAQENAVEVLQRASEAYKNAKSYHFESVRQASISSDLHHSWSESFETLAAIVPENKVRFESREHTGWYVVVSDGKTMWRAVPYTREYAGTTVTGPPA